MPKLKKENSPLVVISVYENDVMNTNPYFWYSALISFEMHGSLNGSTGKDC